MTIIELYRAVANNEITDECIAKAKELIEKDEAAKAKRAQKAAEKKATDDSNVGLVKSLLTNEPQTGADLVAALEEAGATRADGKALTTQYVARLVKIFVDDGSVEKTTVKVTGSDGKSKSAVGYMLAE